jgi:hypothetical protein
MKLFRFDTLWLFGDPRCASGAKFRLRLVCDLPYLPFPAVNLPWRAKPSQGAAELALCVSSNTSVF